jgi:phosphoribosyl 1,2-cyclic phosphodiesterase
VKIICLASSSSGNCYVLDNGGDKLLLEGGIPYKEIIHRLNRYNLKITDLCACLISHGHKDHAKAADEISRFIPIYGSVETLEEVKGKKQIIRNGRQFFIRSYNILPFQTEHDCAGSLGFIIRSVEKTLLFATDTKYIKYNLSNYKFTHVMIECNYLDELLEAQETNPTVKKRLINSHMSLRTCVKTLKSFDLSACVGIYLLHLSDVRSDEKLMKKTVASEFGVMTYVCGKNGVFS